MTTRPGWETLPKEVQDAVAQRLGSPVVEWETQPGGFSPGLAERLVLADGRRLFVKIVDTVKQPSTATLHRREAEVLRTLPSSLPIAALVDAFDADNHYVLVLEDIDGHHPAVADTGAALDALTALALSSVPPGLPRARDEFVADHGAWERLRSVPPTVSDIHDAVITAAGSLLEAVDGESLTHFDARADNMLIDAYGSVRIVDWPWAVAGAPWIDPLMYLVDVLVRDPAAPAEAWLAHDAFAGASDQHIDAILAGIAGSWYECAEQPSPPGMPTLREFQRREADAAVLLLRRRWSARRLSR